MIDVLFLHGAAVESLSRALLHTLWQGAVIMLLLRVMLSRLPARRPGARYVAALTAQLFVLAAGVATWAFLDARAARPGPLDRTVVSTAALQAAGETPPAHTSASALDRSAKTEPARPVTTIATIGTPRWPRYVAGGWICGVVLMLLRLARVVSGARRLAHGPLVADPHLRETVARLAAALGLGRSVRLVQTDTIGPAVLGIIWPTLLLPVSRMAGLPLDVLESLLAHELAHIRRHDYLLNLVQMVVEAVLFFNPAVWWIGRQIRGEREACCDALAVAAVGAPLAYSQALADWADDAARTPESALALSDGRPRRLLDRVSRIVLPDYRPELHLSLRGLVLLLVTAATLVAGLHQGTVTAVVLAAQILSPEQRAEQLRATRQTYLAEEESEPRAESRRPATLKGRILDEDGRLVAEPRHGQVLTVHEASTRQGTEWFEPEFSVTVGQGRTYFSLDRPDGPPNLWGPFEPEPGEVLTGLELRKGTGKRIPVRVVDTSDASIAGADVTLSLVSEIRRGPVTTTSSSQLGTLTTGSDGTVTFTDMIDHEFSFSVSRAGYQPVTLRTPPGLEPQGLRFVLERARPTTGVVVAADGTPVPDVTLRLMATATGNNSSHSYGANGPLLATTGADGTFTIDTFDDGTVYCVLVESPDGGLRPVAGLRAGQEDVRLTTSPPLWVAGTVTGDLSRLELRHNGEPILRYRKRYPPAGSWVGNFVSVNVSDDRTATFRIDDLWPGELEIDAGDETIRRDVQQPIDDLRIDLSSPAAADTALRPVTLRFTAEDGEVPPLGTVRVISTDANGRLSQIDRYVPIEDGIARFGAHAPGSIRYYLAADTLAAWFRRGEFAVPAGANPLEQVVPTVAAGAIHGTVADPGNVISALDVTVEMLSPPQGFDKSDFDSRSTETAADGRFFLTPLPLGGTYRVTAARGHSRHVSEPIVLDRREPDRRLTLRLAPTLLVSGQVLSPEEQPLEDIPVEIVLRRPELAPAVNSWSTTRRTDEEGRFEFEVNAREGEYALELHPRATYQPVVLPLQRDGAPLVVRLQRGRVVEGRLVRAGTEDPVAEVALIAEPLAPGSGGAPVMWTEGPTDAEGRFRFSTLGDGPYRVSPLFTRPIAGQGFAEKAAGEDWQIDPASKGPVTLRAK